MNINIIGKIIFKTKIVEINAIAYLSMTTEFSIKRKAKPFLTFINTPVRNLILCNVCYNEHANRQLKYVL